jgi:outer membrane protein OmpA-like peptidoglycan-associated protein
MRIKSLTLILLTGFISWAVFFPAEISAKTAKPIEKVRKSKRKHTEQSNSKFFFAPKKVIGYSQDSAANKHSDREKISADSILAKILCPACDDDNDGIPNLFDACPNIPGTTQKYGCPPNFRFSRPEIVKISFPAGKTEIPNSSQVYLFPILKKLKENPSFKIRICGYTDNVGEYSDNIKTSQKRADAVKDYLVSKGINGARITTTGFGPNKPIADNRTENGRKANRRIEIYWD